MLRDGKLLDTDSISELGIFGYLVRRGDKLIANKQSGHMIRTKVSIIRSICFKKHVRQFSTEYCNELVSCCPTWQHAIQSCSYCLNPDQHLLKQAQKPNLNYQDAVCIMYQHTYLLALAGCKC